MKIFHSILSFLFLIYGFTLHANGICIVDGPTGSVFHLASSDVKAVVTDQIATVTATSVFKNNTGADTKVKFAFPMTQTASAVSLRWQYEGAWFEASFSPQPQDTTLPGGGGGQPIDPDLLAFLGETPLYFELEQTIKADSFLTIELVYVDLLPYAFAKVSFDLGHDYSYLQPEPVGFQRFLLELHSQRTIEAIELLSHSGAVIQNDGNNASVEWQMLDGLAADDYRLEYQLNADELGIFPFSTYLPDSTILCDDYGRGFFAFIVEPDPSENTAVIEKVFTLIIDRSGSMSGEKMAQARDAASFIMNNLNAGDYFNLVSFDDAVSSFANDHVPYTLANKDAALAYIEGLDAGGSTNISGAFSEAIPDFSNSNQNVANIILFFTDGQATAGITGTQEILAHVQGLITTYEVQGLNIFTFGIGSGANQQLLTLLANNNNGLSEFLESQDLQETISNFYLTIQNPVLLYPEMTFTPPVLYATHPQKLPNLFKGKQLIVVGRYEEAVEVNVHFSGTAFGQPVSYDYTISLSDTTAQSLQFLPRLWAKQKMKDLFQDFFSTVPESPEAIALEDSIVGISLCYGVISPFTSFEDDTNGGVTSAEARELPESRGEVAFFAAPNPFREEVVLYFTAPKDWYEVARVEIYDPLGRLVTTFELVLGAKGSYTLRWDGTNAAGVPVLPGCYSVKLITKKGIQVEKLLKL